MFTYHMWLLLIDGFLLVVMSVAAFVAFLRDKKLAMRGTLRIKEKTLLSLAVLNGAFGALLGRIISHHKTEKKYFSITIYFGLLCQLCVLVMLALFVWVL